MYDAFLAQSEVDGTVWAIPDLASARAMYYNKDILDAAGVEVPTTKSKPYSIDDNLWGRAIECGVLEDPMNRPPLDIYTMTTDPEKAPDEALEVEVEFKAGVPCAIDGKEMSYL